MIIITGTQRSGTSFMAKFFHQCGFDLGTEFWDERIDGGYENPDICNFFRDQLGTQSFPFKGYWDQIPRKQFYSFSQLGQQNHPLQVAKFSYLLMNTNFIQQWWRSRGTVDKFIVMDRSPREIIRSKKMRKKIFEVEDWEGLNLSLSQLITRKENSLWYMRQFQMPYIKVKFPWTAQFSPVKMIENFTGLDFPADAEDIWNNLYDPSKIHFSKEQK